MLAAVFVLTTAFLFIGCDGEDEPIPAYIQINDFETVSNNPTYHGSVSHKITNATAFVTDKTTNKTYSLGMLSLPAKVPVIVTGEFDISLDPVIKSNGNSFFLEVYPFYERFTGPVTLQPTVESIVNPTTSYIPDANFRLIENFEGTGHLFSVDRDNNPATSLEISDEDVFEGESSGRIVLDTSNNVFVVASNQLYEINMPEAGKVFMEVNYKTDIPLEFGVLAINALNDETPSFEFGVFAKEEWNKIYFNLTNLVATAGVNRFVLVIRGGLPIENGQFALNEAKVYLDNIKLIHF